MPCDQQIIVTVSLGEETDHQLLRRALTDKLGWKVRDISENQFQVVTKRFVTFTIDGGTVLISERQQHVITEIKVAYAKAGIEQLCEQFGLQLNPTNEDETEGQIIVDEGEEVDFEWQ